MNRPLVTIATIALSLVTIPSQAQLYCHVCGNAPAGFPARISA